MKTLIICKYWDGGPDTERVKHTIVDENGKTLESCPIGDNERVNLMSEESYDADRNKYLDISLWFDYNNGDVLKFIKKNLEPSLVERLKYLHYVCNYSNMMKRIADKYVCCGYIPEYEYVYSGHKRIKYIYNDCARKAKRIETIIDNIWKSELNNGDINNQRRSKLIRIKYEARKKSLARVLYEHYDKMLENAYCEAVAITENIVVCEVEPLHFIGISEFATRNNIDIVIRF